MRPPGETTPARFWSSTDFYGIPSTDAPHLAKARDRRDRPCRSCSRMICSMQWLRAAGHSSSGGADIGECLAAARQIREPDAERWFRAWSGSAEGVQDGAKEAKPKAVASARFPPI